METKHNRRRMAMPCASSRNYSFINGRLRKVGIVATATATMVMANLPVWNGVTYSICGTTKTIQSGVISVTSLSLCDNYCKMPVFATCKHSYYHHVNARKKNETKALAHATKLLTRWTKLLAH